MTNRDTTTWRLLAIENFSGALDLTLVVDTQASTVVEAIEGAARENGIVLERVEDDAPAKAEPDAANAEAETADVEESRPPAVAPGSIAGLVVTGQADTRHR